MESSSEPCPKTKKTKKQTKETLERRRQIMNDMELEKRKARAASETLVISQTDGGFRVYNPANITHIYMVTGIPDSPKCNCPDYETHQSDPEWRCKHILAVLNQLEKQPAQAAAEDTNDSKPIEKTQNGNQPAEKKKVRAPRNGHSEMTIKRSVSLDGFINSLSVEFSTPSIQDQRTISSSRQRKPCASKPRSWTDSLRKMETASLTRRPPNRHKATPTRTATVSANSMGRAITQTVRSLRNCST